MWVRLRKAWVLVCQCLIFGVNRHLQRHLHIKNIQAKYIPLDRRNRYNTFIHFLEQVERLSMNWILDIMGFLFNFLNVIIVWWFYKTLSLGDEMHAKIFKGTESMFVTYLQMVQQIHR